MIRVVGRQESARGGETASKAGFVAVGKDVFRLASNLMDNLNGPLAPLNKIELSDLNGAGGVVEQQVPVPEQPIDIPGIDHLLR